MPGHDLNYQAALKLISPPELPRTLLANLAAAERIVSTALSLLLAREKRIKASGYAEVSICEAAEIFAAPLQYGLTSPEGTLGGDAGFNLYRTAEGWIALAALEPHFWERLLSSALKLKSADKHLLQKIFLTEPVERWAKWAAEYDIPLAPLV